MNEDDHLARAALSTLNSIQVSKGIIHWRAPRPAVRRFLDALTGQQRRLDEVFDSHVANALEGLHGFVGVLRERIGEQDIILAATVSKLRLVRSNVQENSVAIRSLTNELGALEQSLRIELDGLWREAQFGAAAAELNGSFALLMSDRRRGRLSYVDLWRTVDHLWWGRVGEFIRSAPGSQEALGLRASLIERIGEVLKGDGMTDVFVSAPLLSRIEALPTPVSVDILDLHALEPTWRLRPLTSAVLARSQGTPLVEEEQKHLPIVTTAEAIGKRLLAEAERGTETTR